MVYGHFNNDHALLPSPEQILQGIVEAQIDEFQKERYENLSNFIPIIKSHTDIWKKIFQLAKMTDMKKPLTPEIL